MDIQKDLLSKENLEIKSKYEKLITQARNKESQLQNALEKVKTLSSNVESLQVTT